jgi:ribulose 1,5-bisphosphate synthetase/thiazole synthase
MNHILVLVFLIVRQDTSFRDIVVRVTVATVIGVFVHFVEVKFAHVLVYDGFVYKGEAAEVFLDGGGEGGG